MAPPTLQNSGIFHASTRPRLHFDGLLPKSRRSVVWDLGCVISFTKTHSFWFGLELPTRRSRSTSVHKCIPYNNRYLQNFIEIGCDLAVWGPKTCFGVKTEKGQAYAWPSTSSAVAEKPRDASYHLEILSFVKSQRGAWPKRRVTNVLFVSSKIDDVHAEKLLNINSG